jgi:A/G-specific adenine glycosylase
MSTISPSKKYFTKQLVSWHNTENDRNLPWKNEKDPYKIWLSEIILQQTRAQQGLPYYLRFIAAYPTVRDMAAAKDEAVFLLWQGLGYYNRCKNMLATARHIAHELNGKFPDTYETILELRGIGTYTAAAISSFAFSLPYAVVDGNVYRILSRYFGIDTPYDTVAGKKEFSALAAELLYTNDSAAYNQAIMDLGATVCTPRKTDCESCPLQKHCVARINDLVNVLPIKSKKLVIRKRHFHYLLLKYKNTVWISKRRGRDIWENLHEPYLIEHDSELTVPSLKQHDLYKKLDLSTATLKFEGKINQKLTHQIINTAFFSVELDKKNMDLASPGKWLNKNELKNTAFPKTVLSFFKNNLYF